MSYNNPTGERDIDLALRKALEAANPERAREALRRGADPNASIRGGGENYTPLLSAADAFKKDQTPQGLAVVEALLEAGARVDMAGAESAFAATLVERFNAGSLVAIAGVQHAVSIEPGMSAWALPWMSYRMEGGHWTEAEIKEQHFAYLVPMRGVDDEGNPISFLLMGQSRDDVERAQEPKKFPEQAASRAMRWVMELDAKRAHAGWHSAQLEALLLEADRAWNFAWLLNPARLEREQIEGSTPNGPSRGPRASL